MDPEIEAAARFGVPGMPLFLAKETVNFLGQTRNPSAARALMTLLGRWESFLTQGEIDEATRNDGFGALDRLASAIARQGYPQGWVALVEHALGRQPGLGATMERLADLGSQDLSQSPEVVDRLLGEIEESMPRGMLGRLVGRRDQDLPALVGALAGTRTPEVRQVLEDVAERLGRPARGPGREARDAADAGCHPVAAPGCRARSTPTACRPCSTACPSTTGDRHPDPAARDPGRRRQPSSSWRGASWRPGGIAARG